MDLRRNPFNRICLSKNPSLFESIGGIYGLKVFIIEKIKVWLHKKYGWFDCTKNRWSRVVKISDIELQGENNGLCKITTMCEACRKEEKHTISFCEHTAFKVGDMFEYAYMRGGCVCGMTNAELKRLGFL